MRIMISAGEASGDMHGAHLVRAVQEFAPAARFFGMGGPLLSEAGVATFFDPTQDGVLGFAESLRHYRVLRRVLSELEHQLDQERPDVVVAVDFPGFNMRLADAARRRGIPVVYYFSPSAWAWGAKRAQRVAASGALVCAVFPFEAEFYRKAGARVSYVGHPLLDLVKPSAPKQVLQSEWGLAGDAPIVALLPGSREQELRRLLPDMLAALAALRRDDPRLRALLPAAHTVPDELLASLLHGADVMVVRGRAHDVLSVADVAAVTSGTATLEAAILGTPQVALYRLSGITYHIAKRLVKIDYVALPNIVAGRGIITELIQHEVSGERIAAEMRRFLSEPGAQTQLRQDYAELVRQLGSAGAIRRAAQTVLREARGEPNPDDWTARG